MTSSMDATEGRRDSFGKRKNKEHTGVEYLVFFRQTGVATLNTHFTRGNFKWIPARCWYTCTSRIGLSMVKKRKSSNQSEKDREDNRKRMSTFAQKKMEEQDAMESQARQQASPGHETLQLCLGFSKLAILKSIQTRDMDSQISNYANLFCTAE